MPARKPALERRSRSGPTQPESKRKRRQWLLRVAPEVRDMARDREAARGQDVSSYITTLVVADASSGGSSSGAGRPSGTRG